MRILLAANASYVPPRGGATRSNLAWIAELASGGHTCRVVAAALPSRAPDKLAQLRDEGFEAPVESGDGVESSRYAGVPVVAAADPARRSRLLREQIQELQPDWVLVSSEDIGQVLLREALRACPGRVVYLGHTPQFFPFGPASWNPDPHGAELVARSAGIVAIGRHMAEYIEGHCGRPAAVVHPPVYGSEPYPPPPDSGIVAMINPCGVKGIDIFAPLAARFPGQRFGAVPGWGTTAADRRRLEALPNVEILPNAKDVDDLFRRVRVLVMPSLWHEGFGLVVVQAMLHGIPVVSSDAGGLSEAKLGTRYLLAVRPIERYEDVYDERGMPRAVVPEQDIEPWAVALGELLRDRAAFERESEASREAAMRFVRALPAGALARYLAALEPRAEAASAASALAGLSPEKRALLLERLRKRC